MGIGWGGMGEGLGGGMLGVTLIGNGRNRPEADTHDWGEARQRRTLWRLDKSVCIQVLLAVVERTQLRQIQ